MEQHKYFRWPDWSSHYDHDDDDEEWNRKTTNPFAWIGGISNICLRVVRQFGTPSPDTMFIRDMDKDVVVYFPCCQGRQMVGTETLCMEEMDAVFFFRSCGYKFFVLFVY